MKKYLILFLASALGLPAIGQDKVGILTTSPLGTLDIHRGTATDGTLIARGTSFHSYFNKDATEHTYIRGGKSGSHLFLNDGAGLGNVGIGQVTNPPLQKLHVAGNTYINGMLGINVSSPNAALHLNNDVLNRKIILYESANNEHQFFGFGINGNMLRYQTSTTNADHAFWAATASDNSNELMRIKGNGTVAIGTPTPDNSALLQLNSTDRGLLIPRMNTQQRNNIVSPEPGLMILNVDDQCIDIYDGTNWIKNCGLKITGTDTIPAAWTTMADFGGSPREGAIAFSIGTKGYMGTGYDGQFKNDFWEYDPATNIWTQKANASPIPRTEAVGISITSAIGARGYMGTGNTGGWLVDWWEYNPIANSWTQKLDFQGEPRSEAVGIVRGNLGFVGTGKFNTDFLSDIWAYNPENDTWIFHSDFPYGTCGAVGYTFDEDYLYIGTGWKQGSPNYTTNSFYKCYYDFGAWEPVDDFIGEDRHSAVAFIINGEVYVGLGKTDNNVLKNDIWKNVPPNEDEPVWIQQSNFSGSARANAVAFTISNKVYIGSGNDGGYKNDFRIYEAYPLGNIYSAPALPQPLFSESDGIWTRTNTVVHPSSLNASMIGIGLSNAVNRLDIHTGTARTGNHPTGRSLYVTGPLAADSAGIEFRHSNGTQGIGFGYNTIYATGSNPIQNLGLAARGESGALNFSTNGVERMRIFGGGNVGIGTFTSNANLGISRGVGGDGTLAIYGTTYSSHFNYDVTEHTYIRGGKVGAHVFINDIANLGNVGIGTTGPLQKLHVVGSAYVTGNVGIGASTPVQKLHVDGSAYITNNVGIGTASPAQKLHVDGSAYITNKVGIAVNTPNAPLQFSNVQENRKIVLYEAANNNHQFFGFGTGGGELRYQVNSPADHVFYKGTSGGSTEQMRIRDNGNVDVSGTVEMGWERKTITAQIPAGLTTALTCNCTSPRKVIGGGASADLDGAVLTESYPSTDSQWQVVYKNEAAFPINITVYAICARIGD